MKIDRKTLEFEGDPVNGQSVVWEDGVFILSSGGGGSGVGAGIIFVGEWEGVSAPDGVFLTGFLGEWNA